MQSRVLCDERTRGTSFNLLVENLESLGRPVYLALDEFRGIHPGVVDVDVFRGQSLSRAGLRRAPVSVASRAICSTS